MNLRSEVVNSFSEFQSGVIVSCGVNRDRVGLLGSDGLGLCPGWWLVSGEGPDLVS